MKFFCAVFSIYVLFLTMLPCMDKHEDIVVQKSEITPVTSHGHDQDIDHCSPFCTCNCCASPKIQQEMIISFTTFPVTEKYFLEISTTLVSFHSSAIWQPPQLS